LEKETSEYFISNHFIKVVSDFAELSKTKLEGKRILKYFVKILQILKI